MILDDRYHAGTYGIPDDTTIAAIRMGASLEGMITDPVYEGKSLAGMIDLVAPRRDRGGLERAVRAHRRPAGAERLRRAVHGVDRAGLGSNRADGGSVTPPARGHQTTPALTAIATASARVWAPNLRSTFWTCDLMVSLLSTSRVAMSEVR